MPVSHRDRIYAAEQFSNTVSVTDPADNKLLGVIRLGDPTPGNLSPLYRGQLLVHGLGFSPDRRTLAVVSIGSNSVSFIDTATNTVKHVTYVGRSPHEAFYTPDGKEVWVTVRGENYISVIDAKTFAEKTRITVAAGPGMQIFSPDGMYGYICSSFNPEVAVVTVADHKVVARVKQESPFCPNIAATPDGRQVWFTLKDIGKTQVFEARPPFRLLKTLETGAITNHVNFAHTAAGTFAYVTIGGLNQVKVFRTDDFTQVATIPVGACRMASGLPVTAPASTWAWRTRTPWRPSIPPPTRSWPMCPLARPAGHVYVPGAVRPEAQGTARLQPSRAGQTTQLKMVALANGKPVASDGAPTTVTLFDQACCRCCRPRSLGCNPSRRMCSRSRPGRWHRAAGTAGELHGEPRRRGHRQRDRADPAGRAGHCRPAGTALSCDRAGRRWQACRTGAGAGHVGAWLSMHTGEDWL